MQNYFNKENSGFSSAVKYTNDQQQNCFSAKARIQNSAFSTEATLKGHSVLSSVPTEYSKGLSFGRPSARNIKRDFSNYFPSPHFANPFSKANSQVSEDAPKELLHKFIPFELKNNEEYKLYVCRKVLKNPKIKTNKTFAKTDFLKADQYPKEKISQNYSLLNKRRKISSPKGKVYCGRFTLEVKNYKEDFPIHRDEDVGFQEDWQDLIHESKMDEDVETENEMLGKLNEIVYNDLFEAIEELKNPRNKPIDLLERFPN